MMLYIFAALLAGVASAVNTRNIVPENHLKLDFSIVRGNSVTSEVEPNDASLLKRGDSSELMLTNKQLYYMSTIKIGSQGDEVGVSIDTGSSDLWVMANNVTCYSSPSAIHRHRKRDSVFSQHQSLEFGPPGPGPNVNEEQRRRSDILSRSATDTQRNNGIDSKGNNCTALGVFDVEKSNSFISNDTAPQFSIAYGDKSFAHGTWGTDYIGVGALNVSGCSFAVVTNTSSEYGVFGIGLAGLERTYQDTSDSDSIEQYEYDNFPLRLKSTGVINKVLYSLYLNSADARSGSVLFGAVDHGKYNGQLQTVPIIDFYPGIQNYPVTFHIVLDSVTLESTSRNISVSSSKVAALLDSGTTLSYLPQAILDSFIGSLGGVLSDDDFSKANEVKRVDCSYNTTSVHAMFNFSGAEIRVPMSDLIHTEGSQCYLGLLKNDDDSMTDMPSALLGDNFLRNAYVVYNLEDYEISLAQARYSNSEDSENIEVVSSSVPSAVNAAGYFATSLATSIAINSESHTAVLSLSEFMTSDMTTIGSISTSSEFISSQSKTNVSSAASHSSNLSGSKTTDASSASSSSSPTGSKKSGASKSVYLATSIFFGIMGPFAILFL